MNMTKTEKLLAAKKKLKEFQQNKMMHENIPKQQNHLSEAQCQDETVQTPMISNDSLVEINQSLPSNHESVTNSSSAALMDNNIVIENTNPFTMNTIEIMNKDLQNSESCPEEIMGNLQSNESSKLITYNNFPMGQKESLLEMASQVANVLTNNSDTVESTIETDLVYRNQFLNSYLEEQKKLMTNLHLEINTYRSRILELERELAIKDADFQALLAREINPLKEQLQAHAQTTGILIAEKAELTSALAQMQQSARQSSEEAEELFGKFRSTQSRVAELEREIAMLKANNEGAQINSSELRNDYHELEQKFFELRKEKEEQSLEMSELKQKLNLKKTELMNVQQELQEKTALLSLSELKMQQMKDATPTEADGQDRLALEQELNRVKATLAATIEEKDSASQQYQNYIRQLDMRQSKLLSDIQLQNKTIEDLQTREGSYVQRLSELEQQLQQEREKTEALQGLQGCKEEIAGLLKNIDELTLEQERLHIVLAEKDTQIEELTNEVRDLKEVTSQHVEVSKLATALEGEQLGASRAVSQNQQLKKQLTEMENAFVSLSNAKLDLTEQLQAERSVGKKLNALLNKVESEVEELKQKLQEKEIALHEMEKETLQNAQIVDQIQHYQAQSQHVQTFQEELQNAKALIDKLEKEKRDLVEKLNAKIQQDESLPETQTESPDHNGDVETDQTNVEQLTNGTSVSDTLWSTVKDPVKKLEERFKETMERVAELTEEKQKLEHLVMQLQSETETIGEYITLYQKQRAVLQSRARDRENAFKELLEQRNQQQEQLHKMKVLVSNFLTKQVITPNGPAHSITETKEVDMNKGIIEQAKEVDGETPLTDEPEISELLDLLTEIKDCKDSCVFDASFHPCPWCSGKLITV